MEYKQLKDSHHTDPSPSPTHISTLPDELLVKIFSYLTQRERWGSIVPVCSCWRKLTVEFFPWDYIMCSGKGASVFVYPSFDPCVERHDANVTVKYLVDIVKAGCKISHLNLLDLSQREMDMVLGCCITEKTQIQKLTITTPIINKSMLLKDLGTHCKSITHLNLDGCIKDSFASSYVISSTVKAFINLRSFCLSWYGRDGVVWEQTNAVLQNLTESITNLTLTSCDIGDSELSIIALRMKCLQRLKIKTVGNLNTDGITDILTQCKSIQNIDIYGHSVRVQRDAAWIELLLVHPTLVKFFWKFVTISKEVVKFLKCKHADISYTDLILSFRRHTS